jgi:hypothetical protein
MHSTQNLTFRKDIFTNISLKTIINNIAKRLEPSFNHNPNITEVPNFYKAEPALPAISTSLKETLSRMCSAAAAKLTTSQKNLLEKANQYGMSYQVEISESNHWNKFVDAVYEWEDLLEEAKELKLNWNEARYAPKILSRLIAEARAKDSIIECLTAEELIKEMSNFEAGN